MRTKSYIVTLMLLIPVMVLGQNTQEETIKRSVTLYNPYKPTLQDATKRGLYPPLDDTSNVRVKFNYTFTPGEFAPSYTVSPIKPATLSPDPLPKLYKGYVNLGLGTYLTPFIEVSISNERSKKGALGLYTRSYASAGKMTLDNSERVFAGFMDNQAILFGKKYFKRSRFDGDIDFRQMSRYAYGYDPSVIGYDAKRKDIRSICFDVTGTGRYFTIPRDSSDINWDLRVKYNYFSRGDSAVQQNPGFSLKGGKDVSIFYAGLKFDYDLYMFGGNLDYKARNLFSIAPYITKGTNDWRFRFGFNTSIDSRDNPDPLLRGHMKTLVYFYPDVEFTLSIVPTYLRFKIDLDGDMGNNQARNAIYQNPWLIPGDTLFSLRNTDNKLRLAAGLEGSMDVSASYAVGISYTFFNDLLLFRNDTSINSVGNYFLPVYDDGDMLRVHGEIALPFKRHMKLTAIANYYRYSLTNEEYAWHKPDWDALVKLDYNLRNKVLASASLITMGKRYASVKEPESVIEMPVHVNLNLGIEYRYTQLLSFWLKVNNISWNKYYEWNYYPSHNFMVLGGFTYSL